MRSSVCYRIVRFKGFFWGRRLFFYRRRFAGFLTPAGVKGWLRQAFGRLADGFFGRHGFKPRSKGYPYRIGRMRNVGYITLRYVSPQFELFWPLAWAAFRFLKIRHLRGRRYRLGLPARGQHTHSNAATTRRIRNKVTQFIRERYGSSKLWEPRKKKTTVFRSRYKTQSRRAAKAEQRKRGVIRTKKKKKDIGK